GAAVIKTVAVLFILFFPMSAWLTPEMSATQSRRIIALTNELRKEKSIPELKESSLLNQAAFKKAQDMAVKEYFAHTSPENKKLNDWLGAVGYKYSMAGENLAMGFSAAEEIMQAWEDSPTHYANLIDKDFQEIGVAMADGAFQGQETTFAAQYFALPPQEITQPVAVETIIKATPEPAKATVAISEPTGKKEKIIQAQAELPANVKTASLVMGDKEIELQKDEANTWTGSEIISKEDYEKISQPVVLASINSTDYAGEVTIADVESQDIKPQKVSIADQYLLLKNNPNKNIAKIINFSSFYFFFLLIIVAISLILNISAKLKKQHPSLVIGGVSMVAILLIFLII
ncbi:MAG: CAP domain-containing protein, partial [Patescibacteria group bacterium]